MSGQDAVIVAAQGIIDAGKKGFVTCESISDIGQVVVRFRNHEDAQAYHRALLELTLSLSE